MTGFPVGLDERTNAIQSRTAHHSDPSPFHRHLIDDRMQTHSMAQRGIDDPNLSTNGGFNRNRIRAGFGNFGSEFKNC